MEYLVMLPFTWGETDYVINDRVGQEIEDTPNFRSLCDGYLLPLREDTVEHCYIVIRRFQGDGKGWLPGEFIDLRDKSWRNEGNLVKTGYLERATASEVERALHSLRDSLPSSPEARFLQDEVWLTGQYITQEHSGRQIAKELGCPVAHVYKALHSFNIPMRKSGIRKKEVT